jgi:transcriptional regulator with XRE-family HTH domain
VADDDDSAAAGEPDQEPELLPARGNAPADELTEKRFAVNLRAKREAVPMSQVAFAQEMTARGWPWRQQTVARIESGQRLIRLGEAKTAAHILRTSIDLLTLPTQEMQELDWLYLWARTARGTWRAIARDTAMLLDARRRLRASPVVAGGGDLNSPILAEGIRLAAQAQELTPEGAVAHGVAGAAKKAEAATELPGLTGNVVFQPKAWDDRREIAEALRRGDIVVVDFTQTPADDLARLLCFIMGATEVRGGQIHRIEKAAPDAADPNQAKFILTPATANEREWDIAKVGAHAEETRRRR